MKKGLDTHFYFLIQPAKLSSFLTSFLTLKCIAMSTFFAKMQMSCPTIIIVLLFPFLRLWYTHWHSRKNLQPLLLPDVSKWRFPSFFACPTNVKRGSKKKNGAQERETHKKLRIVVQLIHPSPLRLRQLQSARGDLIFCGLAKWTG